MSSWQRCNRVDIEWHVGQTRPYAIKVYLEDNGAVRDLATDTLYLTVNREEKPTGVANQLFQIPATVPAPTTDGKALFYPTDDQVAEANAGDWYYDIVLVDSNGDRWWLQRGRWFMPLAPYKRPSSSSGP